MVRPRNGRNLARAIDGARYVVVDGMGHDLPEPVWRPVVEALAENFAETVFRQQQPGTTLMTSLGSGAGPVTDERPSAVVPLVSPDAETPFPASEPRSPDLLPRSARRDPSQVFIVRPPILRHCKL